MKSHLGENSHATHENDEFVTSASRHPILRDRKAPNHSKQNEEKEKCGPTENTKTDVRKKPKKRSNRRRKRKSNVTGTYSDNQGGVYPEGSKEAYMKALHAARMQRYLRSIDEAFGNMTSRSFVFSYFDFLPENRSKTDTALFRSSKRRSPMKQIFGKVKMDDYYPGGPKNQFSIPQERE